MLIWALVLAASANTPGTFVSEAVGFAAAFPSTPRQFTSAHQGHEAVNFELRDGECLFSVQRSEAPALEAERGAWLDQVRQRQVRKSEPHMKLETEQLVSASGFSGIELRFSRPDGGFILGRWYLVRDHTYSVGVMSGPGCKADVSAFVDSFRLLRPAER